MPLWGTLATMPLPDLLQWIASTRKTGTVVVETPDFVTTLTLSGGSIVSASSTDPRCYLGQFLLSHTALTEEQLRRAFERQEQTRVYLGKNIFVKTLLGKILLEDGLLSQKEVERVLRIKVEETVYGLFLCAEGSFKFNEGELPPEELVPISLDILEVLNRGIKRMEEWDDIRHVIPANESTFKATGTAREAIDPASLEARLVPLLAEGRTIRDCMLRLHSTEFSVNKAAHRLVQLGALVLDRVAPSSPPPLRQAPHAGGPPEELVERGRQLFDQRAYADTVVVARQALKGDPTHVEARRLLERSEQELRDSLYAKGCSPSAVPRLVPGMDLGSLAGRSAEERYLLERVNGTWSIGDIVKLSPLKEVEALVVFETLLAEGLIVLDRPAPRSS